MLTTAQVLAQTLREYETEYFFAVTGGDQALWIALNDAGIKVVNCRSEHAAAYMADGYARMSGRPGFVYGQYGPGAANVAAGMVDAFCALSPVISLTSAMALKSRGRYEYQDVDQLPLYSSCTIWNREVLVPDRAAAMLRAAIRTATGRVPGPVHLEIPADVLRAETGGPVEIYREDGIGTVYGRRTAPPRGAMRKVVETLRAAARPLIVAGSGVVRSGAWKELTAFAEALSVPVATSVGGKGAISEVHPLAVGTVGRYSRVTANHVADQADCILAIGTRLGGLVTDAWQVLPAGVRLLQIDLDPDVLGHNYRTELRVESDARTALAGGLETIHELQYVVGGTPWADGVADEVRLWRLKASQLADSKPEDGIHPATVMRELKAVLGSEGLLVADTGYMAAWAGALYEVGAGQRFVRAAGSLGWAYPAALGAALAQPGDTTVAIVGDGGLGYHLSELETAIRWGIPVVAVVLNNRSLAFEYHSQRYLWDGQVIPEVNDLHDVDYGAVARAFGGYGQRVTDANDLAEAIRAAIASQRPALLDVIVSKEAIAPVRNFEAFLERSV